MQAIILAGGYGTRLAPLTYTIAKPMLPLVNEPMIKHLIKQLDGMDIILAANYKREQIEDFFEKEGINAVVNPEPKPLGTAGAVKNAEKYIDGTFIVLNGDIISSLNIRNFIKYHKQKKAKATISLWPVKNVEEYGVVAIEPDGRITKFVEKPPRQEAPSNLINAGAYCLEPEILDYIEEGKFTSMEAEIFPKVINDGHPFYGFSFTGFWIDVGRLSSYIEANRILLKKMGKKFIAGEDCRINGLLKQSSAGNNCFVGENSSIISSIIYNNVTIGKDVVIENSVLADNVVVERGAKIKNSIVGEGEIIREDANIYDEKIWNKPIPSGYPRKQIGNVVRHKA